MSYPRDLDEFEEIELQKELDRRLKLRQSGRCDYCGREITTPICRFPDRHRDPRCLPLGDRKRRGLHAK